jgi:hypothetical protein
VNGTSLFHLLRSMFSFHQFRVHQIFSIVGIAKMSSWRRNLLIRPPPKADCKYLLSLHCSDSVYVSLNQVISPWNTLSTFSPDPPHIAVRHSCRTKIEKCVIKSVNNQYRDKRTGRPQTVNWDKYVNNSKNRLRSNCAGLSVHNNFNWLISVNTSLA